MRGARRRCVNRRADVSDGFAWHAKYGFGGNNHLAEKSAIRWRTAGP